MAPLPTKRLLMRRGKSRRERKRPLVAQEPVDLARSLRQSNPLRRSRVRIYNLPTLKEPFISHNCRQVAIPPTEADQQLPPADKLKLNHLRSKQLRAANATDRPNCAPDVKRHSSPQVLACLRPRWAARSWKCLELCKRKATRLLSPRASSSINHPQVHPPLSCQPRRSQHSISCELLVGQRVLPVVEWWRFPASIL